MPATGFRGPKQLAKAMAWTWQGLKSCYQQEASFRLECYVLVVLIPLAVWLANTSLELLLLVGSWLLVMLVEILNSAIEAVVDMVCGDERHELAGRAKDMGSAAVFVAIVLCVMTWLAILFPRIPL